MAIGDKWRVEVVDYDTDEVVKTSEPVTEQKADKIEDGININLNHDQYYTRRVIDNSCA